MKGKYINKLVNEYSIAWEFCGNNTGAKLKTVEKLNEKLKEIDSLFKFLPVSVIKAMERVQELVVRSQPVPSYPKGCANVPSGYDSKIKAAYFNRP
jgi:hypothetical protein